jgi:hypothetical protein
LINGSVEIEKMVDGKNPVFSMMKKLKNRGNQCYFYCLSRRHFSQPLYRAFRF